MEWIDEIQLSPILRDAVEHRFHLAFLHHVQRQEQFGLDLARERLDVGLGLVGQVGDRKLGSERTEGAGTAPCDRLVVGDTDDQAALAFEQLGLGDGKGHVFLR